MKALVLLAVALVVGLGLYLRLVRMASAQRAKAEARRRWVVDDQDAGRIALAGPPAHRQATHPQALPEPTPLSSGAGLFAEPPRPLAIGPELDIPAEDPALPAPARLVRTPDGEMVLTAPPFVARRSLLDPRLARLVEGLSARMPPGFVLCPRVRLDVLVMPVKPQHNDIDDWRTWRRRVRMRSIDAVVCRVGRAEWRPVVAMQAQRRDPTAGPPPDRLVDDVLQTAGIPVVHIDHDSPINEAWAIIAPYVDAAPGEEAR